MVNEILVPVCDKCGTFGIGHGKKNLCWICKTPMQEVLFMRADEQNARGESDKIGRVSPVAHGRGLGTGDGSREGEQ